MTRIDRPLARSSLKSRGTRTAGLMLCALILGACDEVQQQTQDIVRSVKTIEIGERATARERQLAGRLAASQSSELSFALSGTVNAVLVEEGMDVAEGQVLALLDTRTFELAVDAARARLSSARATFEERRLEFDRQKTLFDRDIVARAALDRAEASLGTARADVEAARSDVERAQRDLERTALSAPFSGSVAAKLIEPFQEVSTGQPAFVLEGAKGLQAEILVPETMIRQVAYGDVVSLAFPTLPDVTTAGTVTEIGSRMDAGNAFPVTVRLREAGSGETGSIRAGMTVRATFALSAGASQPGFLIPFSAIAAGQGQPKTDTDAGDASGDRADVPVFVFDEGSGTVRLVTVIAGDLRGNWIEVFEGLSVGDRVVVAGVPFLRDGMAARLWTPDL